MATTGSQPEIAFGADAPLAAVMRTTRAMRRLKPDPVAREMLLELVEAASWAPSASNGQSYSWVIVDDRATMERLGPTWRKAVQFYKDTVASLPVETMDDGKVERWMRALDYQTEHFVEIPALIVPCYDFWQPRILQRRVPVLAGALSRLGPRRAVAVMRGNRRATQMAEAASVYPGVQNLLLSARALGLGAMITTLNLMFETEFKRILGIPRKTKTFAAIPVGWPLGNFGPVRRRPAAELVRWNAWSEVAGGP